MYVDKPIQVKADHFLSACQGGEKKSPVPSDDEQQFW